MIEVLNPIDIVVQNIETRQDLQVTVLDVKQIRSEHLWQKVTSIRCNMHDLDVPKDKKGRLLRSFGLMVKNKHTNKNKQKLFCRHVSLMVRDIYFNCLMMQWLLL